MKFQLVAADGVKFEDDVYEVLVPTKSGEVALFAEHMPLISAGAPGVLKIRKKQSDKDDAMEQFAVNSGLVFIDGQNAKFVADDVTNSEELSEKEAEEALLRAQKLMQTAQTRMELHEAKRSLEHSSAKLHVARLKNRRHR